MEIRTHDTITFEVHDETGALHARRKIRQFAGQFEFTEYELNQVELVVSELGMNIVKYGVKGKIECKNISYFKFKGIEIVAQDEGNGLQDIFEYLHKPPIMNLKGSLKAGISTIYNLSDEFEYENLSRGVRIVLRKWINFDTNSMRYSILSRPKPGENLNGDAFFVKQLPYYSFFAVIDGLGHGEEAHKASSLALDCIKTYYSKPLEEIMDICHRQLRSTRGAVISLCKIFPDQAEMEYLAVGNVELRILGQINSRMFNWNGTVGLNIETYRTQKYPYARGNTIILYSDGINSFDLEPQVQRNSPQNISAHLLDHYATSADDATVLVIR